MAAKQDLPKDYLITGVEVLESKMLGEGAYGVVKLGKYFGLLCAVKKLKSSMFPAGMKKLDQQTELILQSFYNECDKLSQIRHPNVVQLLGVFADKRTRLPVIVMELMHESLSRLLYRTKTLPFYAEINICHDVSQALAYLHSAFKPPIVHRDLSSNNVLLNEDLRAKITDLGVAKVAKGSLLRWDDTPAPGTLVYMPPEVRKVPADLTSAMDIFALAVNMIQIRTHKFPRPGPEFTTGRLGFSKMISEKERRKDHLDLMGRVNPLRPIAIDCLKDNPRDRPSALQLCERLEKIKDTREYHDSQKLATMKDTEVEGIKLRITELEQEVTFLKDQVVDKDAEVEKLDKELKEERTYTAQVLEESARQRLKYEMGQAEVISATPNGVDAATLEPEPKKKKKNPFRIRRIRSLRRDKKADVSEVVMEEKDENVDVTSSFNGSANKQDDEANFTSLPPIPNGKKNGRKSTKDKLPSPKQNFKVKRSSSSKKSHRTDATEEPDPEEVRQNYKVNKLTWYTHRCLPEGLQGSTLRVHDLGGRLYVCCGEMEDGLPNKGLFYCPIQDFTRWKRATPDVPQYQSASAVVQNELVLIGGLSAVDGKCTGAIQSYDSKAQVWIERFPAMPTPRSSASAFVYAEYVVVAGGLDDAGIPLSVVEVLHIPTQTWETSVRLPIKVASHSLVVCADQVYLVGGNDGSSFLRSVFAASVRRILSSCHRFAIIANLAENTPIPRTAVWNEIHDCPFIKMSAVCSGNQLLAFGGEEVTQSANSVAAEWIWIFSPDSNTWTPVQGMPSARKLCCVTLLPDNNLIVIGGDPDYNRIDIAQIL